MWKNPCILSQAHLTGPFTSKNVILTLIMSKKNLKCPLSLKPTTVEGYFRFTEDQHKIEAMAWCWGLNMPNWSSKPPTYYMNHMWSVQTTLYLFQKGWESLTIGLQHTLYTASLIILDGFFIGDKSICATLCCSEASVTPSHEKQTHF